MAGAVLKSDWKALLGERIEALSEWRKALVSRIKLMDRRALALNSAFIFALLIGIAIIAYVALRPAAVPAPKSVAAGPGAPPVNSIEEPLPVVEPTILIPTDPDSARKMNAAVAFSTAPNPAAVQFKSLELGDDFQRSTDCLATAMLFEAGGDVEGQRAVAQVVLNRTRHPAFPNSVCAVVFQGSERKTGCQFSFTCDGSLIRRQPKAAAWVKAQEVAKEALTGAVFAQVGTATHYHTDWVVPYWSSSLDKITAVKTHLFFRWKGWWGTPPAFRQAAAIQAPIIPAIADISEVHKTPEALAALRMSRALETLAIRREGNLFLIGWDSKTSLEILPQLAATLCGIDPECRVLGWPGGMKALPQADNHAALVRASFLYEPGVGALPARSLWNCKSVKPAGALCASPRDMAAVKYIPPLDPSSLASLVASLPPPPLLPDKIEEPANERTEVAVAKVEIAPVREAAIVMPTRKRRDPCAAMRGVAAADRIGPCAQSGM